MIRRLLAFVTAIALVIPAAGHAHDLYPKRRKPWDPAASQARHLTDDQKPLLAETAASRTYLPDAAEWSNSSLNGCAVMSLRITAEGAVAGVKFLQLYGSDEGPWIRYARQMHFAERKAAWNGLILIRTVGDPGQ